MVVVSDLSSNRRRFLNFPEDVRVASVHVVAVDRWIVQVPGYVYGDRIHFCRFGFCSRRRFQSTASKATTVGEDLQVAPGSKFDEKHGTKAEVKLASRGGHQAHEARHSRRPPSTASLPLLCGVHGHIRNTI